MPTIMLDERICTESPVHANGIPGMVEHPQHRAILDLFVGGNCSSADHLVEASCCGQENTRKQLTLLCQNRILAVGRKDNHIISHPQRSGFLTSVKYPEHCGKRL